MPERKRRCKSAIGKGQSIPLCFVDHAVVETLSSVLHEWKRYNLIRKIQPNRVVTTESLRPGTEDSSADDQLNAAGTANKAVGDPPRPRKA